MPGQSHTILALKFAVATLLLGAVMGVLDYCRDNFPELGRRLSLPEGLLLGICIVAAWFWLLWWIVQNHFRNY
jgi:hypothetical protein